MPTATALIQSALEALHVYAVGEVIAEADLARGFDELRTLVDSWSNESLLCFANLQQSLTLVAAKGVYSLGPNQDASPRPLRVESGAGTAFITDTNGNRYPVTVLNQQQWNMLPNLTSIDSNIPDRIFYDPQFPFGVLNVYPVPNLGYTLSWLSNLALTDFLDLSTPLDFPAGYERALKANLAIALAPYYPQAVLSPATIEAARAAKANIKRTNTKETVAIYDRELVSRIRGSYNIYSGRNG